MKPAQLQGQGATEYLVLLAVVLIIALVSIALLGFFPGTATDQQANQNRLYWQSQYPIAIIDAVGGNDGLWVNGYEEADAIKITLQNNGPNPVQLLAMSHARGYNDRDPYPFSIPIYYLNQNSVFGNIELEQRPTTYQFFDPEMMRFVTGGGYAAYISPPKGNGTSHSNNPYRTELILQPGEKVTVGYTFGDGHQGLMNYAVKTCGGWDFEQFHPGKNAEFRNFQIYYASIVERTKIVKQEKGTLIVPCVEDIGDWE